MTEKSAAWGLKLSSVTMPGDPAFPRKLTWALSPWKYQSFGTGYTKGSREIGARHLVAACPRVRYGALPKSFDHHGREAAEPSAGPDRAGITAFRDILAFQSAQQVSGGVRPQENDQGDRSGYHSWGFLRAF